MEPFTYPGSYKEQRQKTWTTQALLERIFGQNYEQLRGQTLRMVRVRIPGREVCLAHILMPSDPCIYQNLGLHILWLILFLLVRQLEGEMSADAEDDDDSQHDDALDLVIQIHDRENI